MDWATVIEKLILLAAVGIGGGLVSLGTVFGVWIMWKIRLSSGEPSPFAKEPDMVQEDVE